MNFISSISRILSVDRGIRADMPSRRTSSIGNVLNVEKGNRAAVIFRYDEETQKGSALILDAKLGTIEMARVEKVHRLTTLDAVISGIQHGEARRVRIFARSVVRPLSA